MGRTAARRTIAALLVACSIVVAALSDPPNALVQFTGGDSPGRADEQWARAITAALVFAAMLCVTMILKSGLPEQIKLLGFELKGPTIESQTVSALQSSLDATEELTESLQKQIVDLAELAKRPVERLSQVERRIESLERAATSTQFGNVPTGSGSDG